MKLGTLLTIAAIIALIFGLAFLLVPVQTLLTYGVNLDISGHYVARYFGSALLGVGCIAWMLRNADSKEKATGAVLLGVFVMCLTGFFVALADVFYGSGNSLVWINVLIYLFLAVGFGWFYFKK